VDADAVEQPAAEASTMDDGSAQPGAASPELVDISPIGEEYDEAAAKALCEKHGLPFQPPFRLTINGPMLSATWLDGFADFLDGVNKAALSDKDRQFVLDRMGDARTYLKRYEAEAAEPEASDFGELNDLLNKLYEDVYAEVLRLRKENEQLRKRSADPETGTVDPALLPEVLRAKMDLSLDDTKNMVRSLFSDEGIEVKFTKPRY
jgi:hypothetical protein